VYKLAQKVGKAVMGSEADHGVSNYHATLQFGTPSTEGAVPLVSTLSKETQSLLHKTIKKVTEDIAALNMNTAVSSLMILSNQLEKEISGNGMATIPRAEFEMFLAMLAPFVPHVAEEINAFLGNKKSVALLPWPKYDPSLIVENSVNITVQVNGKFRAHVSVAAADANDEKKITEMAKGEPAIQKHLEGLTIRKTIFVPGKVVNFVAN
jgi:leucyl-tRNA synthetase